MSEELKRLEETMDRPSMDDEIEERYGFERAQLKAEVERLSKSVERSAEIIAEQEAEVGRAEEAVAVAFALFCPSSDPPKGVGRQLAAIGSAFVNVRAEVERLKKALAQAQSDLLVAGFEGSARQAQRVLEEVGRE